MPAYSTIYSNLRSLSTHAAQVTLECGRDPTTAGFIQLDNVQHYWRIRDPRIGRDNQMNIGTAATYVIMKDINPDALDFDENQRLLARGLRISVTTEWFLQQINHKHLDMVYALHWLRILVTYIPELSQWKDHVLVLFRTRVAKLRVPSKPATIHPLATSGKNENVTTGLRGGGST